MPTICKTAFEYVSSTLSGNSFNYFLATTTQYCTDPLKFAVIMLIGIGLFTGGIILAFYLFWK